MYNVYIKLLFLTLNDASGVLFMFYMYMIRLNKFQCKNIPKIKC